MRPSETTLALSEHLYDAPYPKRGSLAQRFWQNVIPWQLVAKGCWTWQGGTMPSGYGRMNYKRTHVLAHRVAYELIVGPVPVGLQLDHLCRHRNCVNPAHLEPVTQSVNLRRGDMFHRRKTHCIKGHPYSGENLVIVNRGTTTEERRCRKCLAAIRHRHYHSHLEESRRYHRERKRNWRLSQTGVTGGSKCAARER